MLWTPTDESQSCVRYISADVSAPYGGVPYEDILCVYPWMERLWMKWELDGYRDNHLHHYFLEMQNNPWIPLSACVWYGVAMYGGQIYFRERKPWDCRKLLIAWNLALSLFSLLGFLRMLPSALHWLTNYTWQENLCNEGISMVGNNPVLVWCLLFAWSKFPELIDTFFIVVHKKKLIFLHWYHHVSVLLYAWWTTATISNAGMFYGTMNFGVHAVMYFYYFLMAAKCKPKWFNPKVITILQIAQMVLGVGITASGLHFSQTVPGCWTRKENITAGLLMYGSYLVLFLKFFVNRYFGSASKKQQRTLYKSQQQQQQQQQKAMSMMKQQNGVNHHPQHPQNNTNGVHNNNNNNNINPNGICSNGASTNGFTKKMD